MSKVLDVPRVSGAVIWAKQIERQLKVYMKRIETVLGKGWEQHVDGRRLKETGTSFLKKLDTQQMFEKWISGIQEAKNFEVTGRLFRVDQVGGRLTLVVNFDPQIAELFKEIRNLQSQGFRIPYTLKVISDEAREKYPFATWMAATQRTYNLIMKQFTGKDKENFGLLSTHVRQVQHVIKSSFSRGRGINWDSEKLEEFVQEFSEKTLSLQDKLIDCQNKKAK